MSEGQNPVEMRALAEQLIRIAPQLAEEIAECCEQAYRRGYQQGALYGHGLEKEIVDWRFNRGNGGDNYNLALAPPDTRGTNAGFSCTALDRLDMEADCVSSLINWVCKGSTHLQRSRHIPFEVYGFPSEEADAESSDDL